MITTLVGSFVMLIVIGAIGASIVGITLFQQAVLSRSDITKQAALTDSAFRSDVLWASAITPTDSHNLAMTVPGKDGHCRVSTWTIATTASTTTVTNSVVSYPSFDATVNPVQCSGTASDPSTQTMNGDASADSSFTFANAGGRTLTVTSGSTALDGSTAVPAGIDPKAWGSVKIAAVALNTVMDSSTDHSVPYRFAQTADNLSIVQEATDAPTHFVPEGDLTALP
ncbi:hypothetical protein [Arthrobacter methylotrophus]|uniref:Uncharacterized protein n=1 Tax=Arthrobacter methylotrophus TaxID=121291 RepID=A0ABV5UXM8_9MICC